MNRNWYAGILLAILALVLCSSGRYISTSTQALEQDLRAAYSCAEVGNYDCAKQTFQKVAETAEENSKIWVLLIRRSLIDQLNQTLATIPSYVSRENLADLAVETSRACAQTQQIRQSFFSWF